MTEKLKQAPMMTKKQKLSKKKIKEKKKKEKQNCLPYPIQASLFVRGICCGFPWIPFISPPPTPSSPPLRLPQRSTRHSRIHITTMACAALHLSTPFSQLHYLKPKLHFPTPSFLPKTLSKRSNPTRKLSVNSIDISKEDTPPTSDKNPDSPPPPPPAPSPPQEPENFDKRRLEEKFAVLNTGIYECRSCGYKYDEAVGDPSYPIPPGYQFQKLPDDWRCPTCGAAQSFFESKSVEIAGFAQNQQFGLGGNSLTSGQKALLIYGSLLFFFALFLGGYFLQ